MKASKPHAWLIFTSAWALSQPALAQRAGDNALTSAEDAFGRSVGDSSIGIYGESDVRGFSPTDAGNLRIEGLYFDQQGLLTDRVKQSSTIRVGVSAQSYAFPAPTGIADFSIRKPGKDAVASVGLAYATGGAKFVDLDVKLPADGDRLGIGFGFGLDRDRRPYGGTPDILTAGLVVRYAPHPATELIAFANHYRYTDGEAQPLIFSSGAFLPGRIPRGRFLGQHWNDYSATSQIQGLLGRTKFAGFDLRLGIFRSAFDNDVGVADLLLNTDRSGAVERRIIVRTRDDRAASTSGELRISRTFEDGARQHLLIASLRSRNLRRRFGGAALFDLGPSRSDTPDFRDEPEMVHGPKSRDHIRQTSMGIAYLGKWLGVGELGLSVQKAGYRKRTVHPQPAEPLPETRSSPWLPTATAAIHISPKLALYAGHTRGLEESAAAPIEAVNRNEAPPAIQTKQTDGGVRWTISPAVTAVAGLFHISKPYFSLDSAKRFRELGLVRNTGVELSLAGRIAPGLNLVAGTVFLNSEISGEQVHSGAIGRRPVGSFKRRTLISFDYRPPWYDRLSFDAVIDSSSKRTGDLLNSFTIPARTTLSVGARYRFKIGAAPALLRGQIGNVTNEFGWNVARSGSFTPIAERSYSLGLTADF